MPQNGLKNVLKQGKLNENLISKGLGALVLVIVGLLIFNYFESFQKESVPLEKEMESSTQQEIKFIVEEGKIVPDGLPKEYTIQEGEDLWKISEKFYGSGYNWVDIAKENEIANPNLIAAGQKIVLPKAEVKKLTNGQEEKLAEVEIERSISGEAYQAEKGDHLWSIAVRAYGDGYQWVKIARANNLTDPDTIHPGNNLVIPRQ